MGILFISHDLLTIAALCDRLAILHQGEIVECGPAKERTCRPPTCLHQTTHRGSAEVGAIAYSEVRAGADSGT